MENGNLMECLRYMPSLVHLEVDCNVYMANKDLTQLKLPWPTSFYQNSSSFNSPPPPTFLVLFWEP
jgi:hypothetical protein